MDFEKYVLEELKQIKIKLDKVDDSVDYVKIKLAALRAKSGLWGLLGGAIPVTIALLIYFLKKQM